MVADGAESSRGTPEGGLGELSGPRMAALAVGSGWGLLRQSLDGGFNMPTSYRKPL